MKKIIKLTESELHGIIENTMKKVLKEDDSWLEHEEMYRNKSNKTNAIKNRENFLNIQKMASDLSNEIGYMANVFRKDKRLDMKVINKMLNDLKYIKKIFDPYEGSIFNTLINHMYNSETDFPTTNETFNPKTKKYEVMNQQGVMDAYNYIKNMDIIDILDKFSIDMYEEDLEQELSKIKNPRMKLNKLGDLINKYSY